MSNTTTLNSSAPISKTAHSEVTSYRYVIEVLLFLSYFVFGLSWMGYAPFLGELKTQFNLEYASLGLVISSVSFAKIFIPFVAGALALRLGVARTLLVGMGFICVSLASPFANDFSVLVGTRILFGIGGALVVTLLGSAIIQWFPKEELPIINAFNYVAVNSGITLSLFITPRLATSLGRQNTLVVYALISLVLTLAWAFLGKDKQAAPAPAASGAKPAEGSMWSKYAEMIKMKEVWWLTLAAAGPLSLYLVFNTWLPTYYQQAFGMERKAASELTALANMVGIPAAIVGGILIKKFPARKPIIYIAGALVAVSAFGLFMTSNLMLMKVSAAVFGAGLFLWISPLTTLGMELPGMNASKLAILNGIYYGIGYICAFFAPTITGAIRDASGSFIPGFVIFSIFAWSLLLGGFMLPETGKKKV